MYLSIKTAKKLLQKEAGYTIAAAEDAVAALTKRQFGKRQKVKQADVAQIIAEAGKPTPIVIDKAGRKVHSFSKKQANEIRRSAGRPEI